jgi:hypothetical protein
VKYSLHAWVAVGVFGCTLLWLGASKEQGGRSSASARDLVEEAVSVPAPPVAPVANQLSPAMARAAAKPRVNPTTESAWRDLDESELLDSLSELGADDPELSLRLAREARARFPDSARAAEQAYFEVRSLVNLGRLDEAVTGARALVVAHPQDPMANEVARHLLTHPLTHPTEVGQQ